MYRIKTPAERAAAFKDAEALTSKDNFSNADADQVAEILEAVKTYDRQAKGSELLATLGKKHTEDDGSSVGGGEVEFFNFGSKAFGTKIAKALQPEGSKALVASGSTTVGTPLVVADPLELGKPLQSFLASIPVVRRAPVYRLLRQVSRVPGATVVAPGAVKPVSAMTLQSFDKRLKIVATLSEPINRYDLEDFTNLNLFIQQELQYAIQLAIESQVLNGDGTGENFEGLNSTSGIQLYTAPAGQTDDLVSVRKALAVLEDSGETARQVVMNTADWTALVTKRNSSGNFDLGGAVNEESRQVWGKPVALSGLVPTNTAWVLGENALNLSTDGVTHIEWDASTGFKTNELTARVETRAEVDVTRPSAIVKATFVDA